MINPELLPFLKRWTSEWAELPPNATPQDRCAWFEVVAKAMRLPTPKDVSTDDERWIDSPNGSVRVRIFRHVSNAAQPALVYMHGGGWVQGSPETHWDITTRLASWAKATVISVDYALAPDRPFPFGFNQVVSVMEWASANAQFLGIDGSRLSIGGDSAGANIAAAVALELRGRVKIAGQLLIYPPCDFDLTRPSMHENPNGPMIVSTSMMPHGNRIMVGGAAHEHLLTTDPRVAPLVAASHVGAPPAYIAVAEHDPLRDSGIAYAGALENAGVEVVLDRGQGLTHGYLRAMDYCADSMTSLQRMAKWLAAR